MPYKVTNLMFSRRDPTKRGRGGHRSLSLKRGIVIGHRRIKVGRYLLLTDEEYKNNLTAINAYAEAGAVEVTKLYEAEQIYAPSPTPPAPPEPPKVEIEKKKSPSVIEISINDDVDSDDGVIVIDLKEEAPEPEPVKAAPVKAEPVEVEAAIKKDSPSKPTAKRSKRRRKKED